MIPAFAWPAEFPEVFASGGFDAVISDPPGGSIGQREWIQHYLQQHFAIYDPSAERSGLFIEKGFALLRPGGILGMCTTGRWLRGRAGTPLRLLLSRHQIDEVTVIAGAGGDTTGPGLCALRATNRPPVRNPFVTLVDPAFSGNFDEYVHMHKFPVDLDAFGEGGWSLRDSRAETILQKARAGRYPARRIRHGGAAPGDRVPSGSRNSSSMAGHGRHWSAQIRGASPS